MILCYLDLPVADGRFDSVLVTTLTRQAWMALAAWSQSQRQELPRLARLLSGPLPVQVGAAEVRELAVECAQVECDDAAGQAPSGFVPLSALVRRAAEQRGTALRLAALAGY